MKNKKKASVNLIHFSVCVRRYYQLIFSDKVSAIMLLLQAPLMLLVLSLIIPKNCFDITELWMADHGLFIIVVMCTMMGLLNSYREVCKERDVLAREYDAGLDMTAYVLSKVFVLGTICFVQSIIMCAGSYLVIDFPSQYPVFSEILYWLTLFLVLLASSTTGIFISSVLKSSDSAILPVLLILILQVVLAGNLVALEGSLETISVICISRWGLAALGAVFNRNNLYPEFPNTARDFYNESLAVCLLVLLAMCVIFTILSVLVLKFSFRKKYKNK